MLLALNCEPGLSRNPGVRRRADLRRYIILVLIGPVPGGSRVMRSFLLRLAYLDSREAPDACP
jgi:hypothetical protein